MEPYKDGVVKIPDERFRFEGSVIPVGMAQDVALFQYPQKDLTVLFINVSSLEAPANSPTGNLLLMAFVKQKVFQHVPGQPKAEFERLDQSGTFEI